VEGREVMRTVEGTRIGVGEENGWIGGAKEGRRGKESVTCYRF